MWFSGFRLRTGLALGLVALGVALFVAGVEGSFAAGAGEGHGAGQAPLITDPLHHLSGVIAVPPQSMMGQAKQGGGILHELAGLLTPPVWGPNVDASLNNPAVQNETTIAINPEDSQRVIASANDYRANLQPWVYLSTNGGAVWTNYQVPGTSNGLFYGDPSMTFGTGSYAYFGYLGYQAKCGGAGGLDVSRRPEAGTTVDPA